MAMMDRTTRRLIEDLKRKNSMLTAIALVLAVALIIMTVLYITKDGDTKTADTSSVLENSSATVSKEDAQSSENAPVSSENSSSGKVSSSTTSDTVDAVATPGDTLDSWNLKLVNGKNPLPKGYTVRTEKIKAAYARDVGMLYDARAVSYLNAMCAAAEKDGVNLLVISSHRTNARCVQGSPYRRHAVRQYW